jgi:hypothetical protein
MASKPTHEWLEDADPEDIEELRDPDDRLNRTSLSEAEAEAVQLLHEDGWTVGELEMTFMARNEAIYRAINTGKP